MRLVHTHILVEETSAIILWRRRILHVLSFDLAAVMRPRSFSRRRSYSYSYSQLPSAVGHSKNRLFVNHLDHDIVLG